MKAFIVDRYGKDSVPRASEVPVPEIGDRDVLVRIRAASVNPLDIKIIEGEFKQIRPVMGLLSHKVRTAAKMRGARYSFHFMRADGSQLQRVTELVETGALRPVVDRTFDFDETVDALNYVNTGRAKGKVVLTMA